MLFRSVHHDLEISVGYIVVIERLVELVHIRTRVEALACVRLDDGRSPCHLQRSFEMRLEPHAASEWIQIYLVVLHGFKPCILRIALEGVICLARRADDDVGVDLLDLLCHLQL